MAELQSWHFAELQPMTAIVVKTGLKNSLSNVLTGSLLLRLFRNNATINADTLANQLTPAAFPGYADQDVIPLLSGVTIDPLGRATASASPVIFTRTTGPGSEIEYGWALIIPGTSETLLAAELFSTPRTFDTAGQNLALTPAFYLQAL